MQAKDIPLNDIKPLIEIHDYTPYFLLAGIVVVTVLLLVVLYLLFKQRRTEREADGRRAALDALRDIDLADAKTAAYAITRLGRVFAEDSPRVGEAYANLAGRLEPYKFKKKVPGIDSETRAYYRIFLGMIDV